MAKRKKRLRATSLGDGQVRREEEDRDADGMLWTQEVQVRPRKERKPMHRLSRFKKKIKARAEESAEDGSSDSSDNQKSYHSGDVDEYGNVGRASEREQFTVTSLYRSASFWERFKMSFSKNTDEHTYVPSRLFSAYINWTFTSGFMMVFFSFLCFFMFLIFIFGVFLMWAGEAEPGCIKVGGEFFGHNPETTLADGFALSWTTFTTVGYGMVYTSTGTEWDDQASCSLIVFLCTAESFVGLLYAGMCAAILFGKIGRIQSHAQITFSDAICIQYKYDPTEKGASDIPDDLPEQSMRIQEGENEGGEDGTSESTSVTSPFPQSPMVPSPARDSSLFSPFTPEKKKKIPCPVLKFQLINDLANKRGGEIMDASLKVVAGNKDFSQTGTTSYAKVNLTEFEHPFFSRVWHGSHRLNGQSPLLTPAARERIRKNDGYWPADWCNPDSVRDNLMFSDFIVTLTGIANISAATVHSYKRYKAGDVLIGYEHASLLYKHPDTNRLKVDHSLAHDVVMQRGGGGEPFVRNEEKTERSAHSPISPLSKRNSGSDIDTGVRFAPDTFGDEDSNPNSVRRDKTVRIQKSVRNFNLS
uniref:Potassium channel domain-containing protein n=1 Tax=Helicotheca tamesis TaxID=374047 RepID=A0A7S2H7D9_9STRA|mmetsp:Transcript_1582/g.2262  ORF Transcript_1582/g.2262 Transcript_1582/m.2262 type:complete len:586 (+) Transcript_1582:82-1839(+)|eukprot:CAMPEP_0185729490 /NCGR_PEP_ID=MMETSP1171-20130828/6142_1 /TAXON_ID=374046 /ORGANISM="Helicotheca tamensis, Strain CCMP826" /LENGTH=585 /DNA_ID=CAMNT_0028398345 /DNA_START=24 /DNA_END=1781 /DNA_ORIENTATION=-